MELQKIFEYDAYANHKVYQAILNAEKIEDQNILKLFNHIIGAHHTWLARIGLFESNVPIWPEMSLPELEPEMIKNMKSTEKALKEFDLQQKVQYQNSKGKTFSNSVEDILFHIANHSNYHRAQIAVRMRQSGLEPVETNYIFYKR